MIPSLGTDETDARDVTSELEDVASKFYELGCALRIHPDLMDCLEDQYRYNHKNGLRKVIDLYLTQEYNVRKHGPPTWRRIVAAVSNSMGGCNHALAKKIAQNHRGMNTYKHYIVWYASSRD